MARLCSIEGCEKIHRANGYCDYHRNQKLWADPVERERIRERGRRQTKVRAALRQIEREILEGTFDFEDYWQFVKKELKIK